MKYKKSTILPLVLLIYLTGMGIYTWPGRNPEVTWTRYGISIVATLACIIVLYFVLKRQDKIKEEIKNGKIQD